MSYRNITVDGVKYKYVIGKTHTKVHGMKKVFENAKIGEMHYMTCDCCGESYSVLYDVENMEKEEREQYQILRVTPKNISAAIKSVVGIKNS